ncbi:unnamed protein product [Urochloa humidicola]
MKELVLVPEPILADKLEAMSYGQQCDMNPPISAGSDPNTEFCSFSCVNRLHQLECGVCNALKLVKWDQFGLISMLLRLIKFLNENKTQTLEHPTI